MVINDKLNLTMLCDYYELTMSQGYFATGYCDRIAYFDLFFRQCPDGGGFAIAAGLEQIIQYVKELHFGPEDIEYLRPEYVQRGIFAVSGGLQVHRRYLGRARGNAHFPQ